MNAALRDATIRARYAEIAVIPRRLEPAEFGNFVAAETEKWGKVIRRPTSRRSDARHPNIP